MTEGFGSEYRNRTHGGYSGPTIKPLSLYAKEYDDKSIFTILGEKAVKYSRLLLRTSATDSKHALFRDAHSSLQEGLSWIYKTQGLV